jgi:hypothetical protein
MNNLWQDLHFCGNQGNLYTGEGVLPLVQSLSHNKFGCWFKEKYVALFFKQPRPQLVANTLVVPSLSPLVESHH